MEAHHSAPLLPQHNREGSNTQNQSPDNRQSSSVTQGQACQRCRQQKLRCSRESPKCTRCQRASTLCIYPPPPDRKLLAAQRVRKSRFRHYREPRNSTVPPEPGQKSNNLPSSAVERSSPSAEGPHDGIRGFDPSRADDSQHRRPWVTPETPHASNTHATETSKPTVVPSPEVARLLIEMYFTRVYNATLLFHKETFLSDYAANRMPNFVTHAVFALASIFLPKPSKDSRVDDYETELGISALSTSDFSSYAHEWATTATREVLMQAIEPSLENVQACQVLTLYWFSKDARDHTHILTHLAYTSCRLMGFHIPHAENPDGSELSAEIKRRCLWSCWITACISQDNASFRNESWSEVVGLPFPADEASFAAGKPESIETFNEVGKVVPYNGANTTAQTSIMGEFVKLFGLWWQIQRFVKSYQDGHSSDPADRLQEFLTLDRRLETVFENLHSDFKYSGPSSFTSPKLDPYTLFSLQCLYRLCACALHSSLVPLFSSDPSDPEISKNLVRMCAEETVKHSVITLDMATAFLSTRPDKSRLSSTTGYAMFVSSAVQIRSLTAQGKLKTHAGYLKAAITILRQLKEYWSLLRGLWTKLEMLSFFEGLNINSFTITRIEPETASAGIQTDIEQIASPEAVSESGPGTDLYTYIERREPKVTSQKSSPANTGPQSGAGRTLSSPKDGSSGIAGSQINQARRATVDHLQSGSGGFVQANTTSEMPFPPANPQPPDPLPGQVPLQRGFDHHLSTGTSDDPRPAEIVQLQMAGNAPQVQLYGPPSNPQTMSSEQSDVFRPMMDGFDTMSGMMGMDLNNEDDDLWWARSWGSVRIL